MLDAAKQYILSVNNSGELLWATPETDELLNLDGMSQDTDKQQLSATLGDWLGGQKVEDDLIVKSAAGPLIIRYF